MVAVDQRRVDGRQRRHLASTRHRTARWHIGGLIPAEQRRRRLKIVDLEQAIALIRSLDPAMPAHAAFLVESTVLLRGSDGTLTEARAVALLEDGALQVEVDGALQSVTAGAATIGAAVLA